MTVLMNIENNGINYSLTFEEGFYQARKNGKVFFTNIDYEKVRNKVLNKI